MLKGQATGKAVGEVTRQRFHLVTCAAVLVYGTAVVAMWVTVDLLADKWWWATLVAFGPRWIASLPLAVLFAVVFMMPRQQAKALLTALTLSTVVLIVGVMDLHVGWRRSTEVVVLRIMTHNLGGARVTPGAMHLWLTDERIDVAALQECPFYHSGLEKLGWHFFYGGDLCLVSRYPFKVLDVQDPVNAWKHVATAPLRFEIDTPGFQFQLLNVHFSTIRVGVEALATKHLLGLNDLAFNRLQATEDSRAARARISRTSEPLIVAGDFNLPVESRIYRKHWADFENAFSRCGRGFGHTKFTRLFGIRIDHVLMSPHWSCTDARVLPIVFGGDHAPLIVDLTLAERPD